MQVGATVEVRQPGSNMLVEAVVNRIHDQSMYTVGMYVYVLK